MKPGLRRAAVFLLATLAVTAPARARDKVSVILDWFANADHAALFAAQYCGAYRNAGLDVTLLAPADPDSPPRLLAAGQADLAVGYQTQLNMLDDHGLGLVRIGTLIGGPLNTVMALGESGIRHIADLKGKRIGVTVGGVEDALLAAMLATAQLTMADVTVVRVNFQILPALLSRQLDAVLGAYRNYEAIQMRQMGHDPVLFAPENYGVPAYDELILLARQGRVHDPVLVRFLAALRVGTACLLANPDAMWKHFAAEHPDLDNVLNHAAWNATLPLIARDPAHLDTARYTGFQDFLFKSGVVTHRLPVNEFALQLAQ